MGSSVVRPLWIFVLFCLGAGRGLGQDLGPWNNTTAFPTARYGHGSVIHNGFIYVLGGNVTATDPGPHLNDVRYAPINPNGTLGAWSATTPFVTARYGHTSISHGGFLYVIGGYDGAGYVNGVQSAPINPDGTLGAWSATTPFVGGRSGHTSVVHNGYLYVVGGTADPVFFNDVQFAPIGPGGTVGAWTATTPFPTARVLHTSVANNGFLYVIGGKDAGATKLNDVRIAALNADGTVGPWSATTSFTTPRYGHASVLRNGRLYVAGGSTDGLFLNDVQFAPVLSDGTVGTWSATTAFAGTRWALTAEATADTIFVLGGFNGAFFSDVQFNTLPGPALSADLTNGNAPLNVSLSVLSAPSNVAAYEWDFDGNGTFDLIGSSPQIVHTYLALGTFVPSVRLVFSDGSTQLLSGPAIKILAPLGPAPTTALITRIFIDADGNNDLSPGVDPVLAENLAAGLQGVTVSAVAGQVVGIQGAGQAGFAVQEWELDFHGDGESEVEGTGAVLGLHSYDGPGLRTATLEIEYSLVELSTFVFIDVQSAPAANPRLWIVENHIKSGKSIAGNCVPFKINGSPNSQFDFAFVTLEFFNGSAWVSLGPFLTDVKSSSNSGRLVLNVAGAISAGVLPNGAAVAFRARMGAVASANNPGTSQEGIQGPINLTPTSGAADFTGVCSSPGTFTLTVNPDQSLLAELAEETRLEIPLGAATGPNIVLRVEPRLSGEVPPAPNSLLAVEIRDISLRSGGTSLSIARPVRVRIFYADANQDGIVDNTEAMESTLGLMRFDGATWVPIQDEVRNETENWVEGTTASLSLFALQGSAIDRAATGIGGGGGGCFARETGSSSGSGVIAVLALLLVLNTALHRRTWVSPGASRRATDTVLGVAVAWPKFPCRVRRQCSMKSALLKSGWVVLTQRGKAEGKPRQWP